MIQLAYEPEADEVTQTALYYDISEIEEVLTHVYFKTLTPQDIVDKLNSILNKNREYLLAKFAEEDDE